MCKRIIRDLIEEEWIRSEYGQHIQIEKDNKKAHFDKKKSFSHQQWKACVSQKNTNLNHTVNKHLQNNYNDDPQENKNEIVVIL